MLKHLGLAGSTAVVAGCVVAGMLMGAGTPRPSVASPRLVAVAHGGCGPNASCPDAPAADGGDQTTAEQRVIEGYIAKQQGCTPDTPPNPQSVTWDPPGFTPNIGGTGAITDASPALGGHFRADWVNGRWHIEYPYC
ncbi:MAG: integrase [Mycobacterium sp.]|uniref:integrase n=1 Tax=Mycobacterium sp. TaxID=1785 RepID=UPI001ECA3CF7|nr:integrase [Mycobacterium sp.]MBW0018908.1 integrase [Mycobacterium sp.]